MIDNIDGNNRALEEAIKNAEQAKERLANERKKQNERRRKAENRHKCMMGGIIVKYFPWCYRFEESELNRILSAALATRECRQIIAEMERPAVFRAAESVTAYPADAAGSGAAAPAGDAQHPLLPVVRLAVSLRRRAPGGRTIPSPWRWYICAHPVNRVKKSVAEARLFRADQSLQAEKYFSNSMGISGLNKVQYGMADICVLQIIIAGRPVFMALVIMSRICP